MKVVAAFHAHAWEKHLYRKLSNLRFCDKVVVVLDRPTLAERRGVEEFRNVVAVPFCSSVHGLRDGVEHCDEGLMRQVAWDWAARFEPDWILLGDADETFEDGDGGIQTFLADLADPAVDVYYLPMAHVVPPAAVDELKGRVVEGPQVVVGRQSVWSFESPANNRKGVICRWRPGVEYKYDLSMTRHCRMEPNPLSPVRAVEDATHVRLRQPRLLHWKFWDWEAWKAHPQSKINKYRQYWAPENQEFAPLPRRWLTKECDRCLYQLRPGLVTCEVAGTQPVWECPLHGAQEGGEVVV